MTVPFAEALQRMHCILSLNCIDNHRWGMNAADELAPTLYFWAYQLQLSSRVGAQPGA